MGILSWLSGSDESSEDQEPLRKPKTYVGFIPKE